MIFMLAHYLFQFFFIEILLVENNYYMLIYHLKYHFEKNQLITHYWLTTCYWNISCLKACLTIFYWNLYHHLKSFFMIVSLCFLLFFQILIYIYHLLFPNLIILFFMFLNTIHRIIANLLQGINFLLFSFSFQMLALQH